MSRGFLYQTAFKDHRCMHYHPENPQRLDALLDGLDEAGAWSSASMISPREVTMDELAAVHDETYVSETLRAMREVEAGHLDPDTFFSSGTTKAALEAAGGGVDLATAVHDRDVDWGWALVRPPGHHATRSRAMGFCIFNNLAVAAAALMRRPDVERVAVFDWDVHHGNGTQEQFWNDPKVLMVSMHQWPHFPGSGISQQIGGPEALGRTINFPFPSRTEDGDFIAVVDDILTPVLHDFEPDHILVSAGFDAHSEDPLANLDISTACFGRMADRLSRLARELCDGRLTLFLEGGYNLDILGECAAATVAGIEGDRDWDRGAPGPTERGMTVIEETRDAVRQYWPDAL